MKEKVGTQRTVGRTKQEWGRERLGIEIPIQTAPHWQAHCDKLTYKKPCWKSLERTLGIHAYHGQLEVFKEKVTAYTLICQAELHDSN